MILSGKEIFKRLGNDIIIEPFDKNKLNPNSYNVTLYNQIGVYEESLLDMAVEPSLTLQEIPPTGFILQPNKLYLARTAERTETYNLVPMLEGRSSIGRLGISIHVTAGFGDVGFKGYWTLEITVTQPIRIYPFVEIGQIYYHTIQGEYDNYASGKYQNNQEIQASKLFLESSKWIDMRQTQVENVVILQQYADFKNNYCFYCANNAETRLFLNLLHQVHYDDCTPPLWAGGKELMNIDYLTYPYDRLYFLYPNGIVRFANGADYQYIDEMPFNLLTFNENNNIIKITRAELERRLTANNNY